MKSHGETSENLRIDLWLHRCRFFKTRSQATAAVSGGHVRLNGERPSPGSRVKPNDRIELRRNQSDYVLDVIAIPTRRGPAPEARACYIEDQVVSAEREAKIKALKQDRLLTPTTPGRPDKHTRRQLRKRRRG